MRIILIQSISLVLFIATSLNAQKEDNIWLFGFDPYDVYDQETNPDTTWGSTNIDFSSDPPRIYFDKDRLLDFHGTNGSICDKEGSLVLYTNGQAVFDGKNNVLEDTINYNDQWDNWSDVINDSLVNFGLPSIQGTMILDAPDDDQKYYIVYSQFNTDIFQNTGLYYTLIDLSEDVPVIDRDVPLIQDTLSSGNLHSVRHANGRDWWFINVNRENNKIHQFLITPEGIENYGVKIVGTKFLSSSGQLYFSSDGSKMALYSRENNSETGTQVVIADFDRCTGEFSNVQEEFLFGYSPRQGVCFSSNSRFLYISNTNNLYQYDLQAEDILESRVLVEKYDGFKYFYTSDSTFGQQQRLGWMGLAPDGKIYMASEAPTSRVMHRINNPNYLGEACDLEQHSVYLPTSYASTIPNLPNFRLGPIDGSSCDTLSIDNRPVAKYRYVQDTSDNFKITFFDLSFYNPTEYEWTFGDGGTSFEKEPHHIYDEKGVYEVCLTVSNSNSSDTFCKTIMLGTTTTLKDKLELDVTLFPNPVDNYFNLNFHNYIPMNAVLLLYDLQGRFIELLELNAGSNTLKIGHIKKGNYYYRILDEGNTVYTGQIFKL